MKHFIKKLSQIKWQLISIIFAVGFAVTLFQYVRIKNQVNGPSADKILQKLANVMVLPDETPKITPLTDVSIYKTNWPDFYKDAEPGDILIQYQNSSLLYNPTSGKILNIGVNGILNKPKPKNVLIVAFRYNGNEQYRALWLKRQVEEDLGNSGYQVVEVAPSKATYKEDAVYLVNPEKKDLATQFAKVIGNSPMLEKLEPNEATTTADVIVAFRSM